MTTTATTQTTDPYDYTTWTGLEVDVLRSTRFGDATLNGISARYDRLTLVGVIDEAWPAKSRGSSIVTPFDPALVMPTGPAGRIELAPAAVLIKRNMGSEILWSIERAPVRADRQRPWAMFGGNYAASSDSRLGKAMEDYGFRFYGALAVHDRYEH